MSYPTDRLGKYIDILSGFAFKSKDFSDSGVPVIKIKNITPPYVSLDDITYVSNDIATQQKKFQVHYDDILIALTGSHINQMASVVGRIAKVKFFDKALLNQRVGKIYIADAVACNLDYVYYFLSQEKVKIELASKAGGAANQANISPTDIKNLQIHNAMEKAFLALYGYTSDENGIRHGGIDFTSVPSEDAKYMLVSCSAFVNYLMEKWSKVDAKVGGYAY